MKEIIKEHVSLIKYEIKKMKDVHSRESFNSELNYICSPEFGQVDTSRDYERVAALQLLSIEAIEENRLKKQDFDTEGFGI